MRQQGKALIGTPSHKGTPENQSKKEGMRNTEIKTYRKVYQTQIR